VRGRLGVLLSVPVGATAGGGSGRWRGRAPAGDQGGEVVHTRLPRRRRSGGLHGAGVIGGTGVFGRPARVLGGTRLSRGRRLLGGGLPGRSGRARLPVRG